jgi:hypothetical protein
MRLSFALVVCVVALAAPAVARAGDARLWACHGPDGAALPISYEATHSAGAYVTPTSPTACASAADTIRLGFTNPSPPAGSAAVLRVNAPAGVRVESVWLGRRVTGPGYFAGTSATDLEALDGGGTLDGVFAHAATGSWVELGLRCASAGCDMSGATVDFRFLALAVHDPAPPTFTLRNLGSSASGVIQVSVDAADDGLGLMDVTATLDGVPVGSGAFGGPRCRELSPGDATVDLPLADDCPASRRLPLALDTRLVADGSRRLELTVTDGAGNATVRGADLEVVNRPAPTPTPTPVRTATPSPVVVPVYAPNVVTVGTVGRYRRGAVSVAVTCPARAAASCPVSFTLRAKLPGRKRITTIATARTSVKPGAKAAVKLKLSAAARRALAKRRTLAATLTLAGARPLSVTVRRG